MKNLPMITKMIVIPVAGYDSFLLNLSGGHGPVFIRTIVILEDNNGQIGVGESPCSDSIVKTLRNSEEIVVGSLIGDMNNTLGKIRSNFAGLDNKGRGLQTFDQRVMIHTLTALESALLDLKGKALGVPVAKLLGSGEQRENIDILGYLFFIGDHNKTNLNYKITTNPQNEWDHLRHVETLNSEGIVRQAKAAQESFGFQTFKLKGGVLPAEAECECINALAK